MLTSLLFQFPVLFSTHISKVKQNLFCQTWFSPFKLFQLSPLFT